MSGPRRWALALTLLLVGLALIAGALAVLGTVWIRDPSGQVVRAILTNDREEQALWRLPGGRFAAIPRLEGEVEIICRDGRRDRGGYVSEYFDTSLRVEPGCRLADDR